MARAIPRAVPPRRRSPPRAAREDGCGARPRRRRPRVRRCDPREADPAGPRSPRSSGSPRQPPPKRADRAVCSRRPWRFPTRGFAATWAARVPDPRAHALDARLPALLGHVARDRARPGPPPIVHEALVLACLSQRSWSSLRRCRRRREAAHRSSSSHSASRRHGVAALRPSPPRGDDGTRRSRDLRACSSSSRGPLRARAGRRPVRAPRIAAATRSRGGLAASPRASASLGAGSARSCDGRGGPVLRYWDDTTRARSPNRSGPAGRRGRGAPRLHGHAQTLYPLTGTRSPGDVYVNPLFWYYLNRDRGDERLVAALRARPGLPILYREPITDVVQVRAHARCTPSSRRETAPDGPAGDAYWRGVRVTER